MGARSFLAALALAIASACGSSEPAPAPQVEPAPAPVERVEEPAPPVEPEPPIEPEQVVLRWHVAQALWGEETIEVRGDGRASYAFAPAGPGEARQGTAALSSSDLAALLDTIRDAGACGLRSARRGRPDEGRPTLDVHAGALACSITMWDGEWRDRARPVLDAMMALRDRIVAEPAR